MFEVRVVVPNKLWTNRKTNETTVAINPVANTFQSKSVKFSDSSRSTRNL